MRIAFIGNVESSYQLLQQLLRHQPEEEYEVVALVTKSASKFNADHTDLLPLLEVHQQEIPVHFFSGDHEAMAAFLQPLNIDLLYCFGWSHLLKPEVIRIARKGAVGFHPSKLPQNRGRHPIIWALVQRLTHTASSFFMLEEAVDSGAVISQSVIAIEPEETAQSLYDKIVQQAKLQVLSISRDFCRDRIEYLPQESGQISHWRKRSRKDGLIDWRMRAEDIHALVRALSRPYPGAECLYQEQPYIVWQSRIEPMPLADNIVAGEVLAHNGNQCLVKCGGDTGLWLCEHELPAVPEIGSYL